MLKHDAKVTFAKCYFLCYIFLCFIIIFLPICLCIFVMVLLFYTATCSKHLWFSYLSLKILSSKTQVDQPLKQSDRRKSNPESYSKSRNVGTPESYLRVTFQSHTPDSYFLLRMHKHDYKINLNMESPSRLTLKSHSLESHDKITPQSYTSEPHSTHLLPLLIINPKIELT